MATGRGDGPGDGRDVEEWEEGRPRSILNATWFRALIVVLVIGAVAAVAVPYVMDMTSTPRPVARVPAAPPATAPTASAPAAPAQPAAPAPAATPAPTAPAVAQAPKPDAAKPEAAKPPAATPAPAQPGAPASDAAKPAPKRGTAAKAGGELWVQVGAFRDQAAAQRVAATLKEKGLNVAQSTTASAAPAPAEAPAAGAKADRYDVVVSGGAPGELVQKLGAKGLSAERTGDGAVLKPSLPLREAVALSNDLRNEGFKVTVRRVGGGPAPAAAGATGDTLHRVRVGPFPDRAAAREAVQKLEALGYKPFIARGP